MTSWQQESLRMRVVATCTSTFPCLFPAPCQQMQGRTQMGHCVLLISSAHHQHSTGRRYNNGEHLDRGREKAASRIDRGLTQTRRLHSRQKWGGFPSPGTTRVPAFGTR